MRGRDRGGLQKIAQIILNDDNTSFASLLLQRIPEAIAATMNR